jgi:hypothetical protein
MEEHQIEFEDTTTLGIQLRTKLELSEIGHNMAFMVSDKDSLLTGWINRHDSIYPFMGPCQLSLICFWARQQESRVGVIATNSVHVDYLSSHRDGR